MPLYDYKCPKCGIFEAWREREEAYTSCPMCEKTAWRLPCSGGPYSKTETGGDFLPGKPMREK